MAIYIVTTVGDSVGADIGKAKALIRAAKECGAEAVRFNSLSAESLAHPLFAAEQYEVLGGRQLTRDAHFELAAECHSVGIDFISAAFDFEAVDLLCELGAPAIRICSGDATNLPLIAYAARQEKPLFISTGMCTLAEAGDAYYCAIEEGCPRAVMLQSTSAYPAPLEDVNLQAIATLAGELFCEVGFSDHSVGIDCCVGAAALGATVIEKHLVAADDPAAEPYFATPDEFAVMVQRVRTIEQALGNGEKLRMPSEVHNAEQLRRTVFYSRDLPAGHVITWDDITFLRPVVGLSPAEAYRFVGRTLGVDMQAGELASEQDIAVIELKEKSTPQTPSNGS